MCISCVYINIQLKQELRPQFWVNGHYTSGLVEFSIALRGCTQDTLSLLGQARATIGNLVYTLRAVHKGRRKFSAILIPFTCASGPTSLGKVRVKFCMQDTFARARARPKGLAAARPSARDDRVSCIQREIVSNHRRRKLFKFHHWRAATITRIGLYCRCLVVIN